MLICVLMAGCGKPQSREFTASFEVQPTADGRSVMWSLQFTRDQYHAMLNAANTSDAARPIIRELITTGFQMHHLVGCTTRDTSPTALGNDRIAFIGICPVAGQSILAGGI